MMATLRRLARRLLSFARPSAADRALDRELSAHIDLLADEYVRRGASADEARAAARRAFGSLELVKDHQRDARSFLWMDDARRDGRYAVRALARNPGFTFAAVLTLAIGIGATTAVFSLVDGLMLRPLPVRHPEELVLFGRARTWGTMSGVARAYDVLSYPQYVYFRDNNQLFPGGLAGVSTWQSAVRLRLDGAPVLANAKLVSGTYFPVFGVNAAAGRLLGPSDDRRESPPSAVLSYRYWVSRFNRAPDVVNRTILVNDTPFVIVGVAAPEFFGETLEADPPDLWFPIARFAEVTLNPSILPYAESRWMYIVGRAAPGANRAQLSTALTLQLHQWLEANEPDRDQPEVHTAIERAAIDASSAAAGISHLRGRYGEPLEILLAIAALVLAVACGNVCNLLLARATARQREMSLRLALGASRSRLVRQLLTESLLLSLMGGYAGVVLAAWATRGLLALVFRDSATYGIAVSPDARLLAFASATVFVSGMLFGLAPAWHATREDLTLGLKSGGRLAGSDVRGLSTGKVLVAAQVALSLLLAVGAGLLVRSVSNLSRQDFVFDRDHILLVHVDPKAAGYRADALADLYRRIEDAVDSRPGVKRSALALYTPLSGQNWDTYISVAGFDPDRNKSLHAVWVSVTPPYLDALGIPVLLGRRFDARDAAGAQRTAVVNESFVRDVFKGENPIGRRFGNSPLHADAWEIVGVVKDTKHADPRGRGTATFFLPVTSSVPADPVLVRSSYLRDLVVRANGDPATVAGEVREALAAVDDRLVVTGVTTMNDQIRQSFNQVELMSVLSTVFGAVALLLAAIGLYGVMAYSVARRRAEIAVRMALGAEGPQVAWMVVREILGLVGLGIAVGVPLVVAATRLISAHLFGIGGLDPLTIAIAALLLTAIGAAAGYLPARQAARMNPVAALRDA